MTKHDDGGPAYPSQHEYRRVDDDTLERSGEGMTLLDYYAGLAMKRHSSDRPNNLWQWFRWAVGMEYQGVYMPQMENASAAFDLADAMITEKRRRETEDAE